MTTTTDPAVPATTPGATATAVPATAASAGEPDDGSSAELAESATSPGASARGGRRVAASTNPAVAGITGAGLAGAVDQRPAFLQNAAAPAPGAGERSGGEKTWSARSTEPGEAKPESVSTDASALATASAAGLLPAGLHLQAPVGPAVFALPAAAPPLPAAASMWKQAGLEPSLRATVMPETAVLSFDSGGGRGEVSVHLRVKDGVTDVRVDGAGAASLELHPQELRVALAGEGLQLGSFESGQSAPHQGPAEGPEDRSAPPPPAPLVATSQPDNDPSHPTTSTATRGVHITA